MLSYQSEEIEQMERHIATLTARLAEAKSAVAQWADANTSLSLSAAQVRAKNQETGRGLLGSLLGSKFRSAMRAGATASNAALAKEVAEKRARIAEGKRDAQELVRQLQSELTEAKQQLKKLTSITKVKAKNKTETTNAAASIALLQKLKEAKDAGLLTQEEFEEKRKKLVADI